jgi:ligand-binding sensor domain-containing protein
MSQEKNFGEYLSVSLLFILALIICYSCEKADHLNNLDYLPTPKEDTLKDYSPVVRFDITGRMLEGKLISCIEPNYKGNTWIASDKELYHYKNDSLKNTYTLDYQIFDISIAGDETLWMGTRDGGLGHLTEDGLTWYTVENSDLPRDYIKNVEVGRDGRVWFSSCAHDRGGLLVFDGKKFDLFSPDNSILNQQVIDGIDIDHDGAIYILTIGTVGKTNVYRIFDDLWECLGDPNGTFYWTWGFTVGPAGIIYLIEDFMLSSSSDHTNVFYEFRNETWNTLDAEFLSWHAIYNLYRADRRNYCWVSGIDGDSYALHVYNGTSWEDPPEGLFLGDKITVIETDMNNNVWVGTAQNGVFILKQ